MDSFNLLSLIEFLRRKLTITEKVKDILKFQCDEAAFSLKSWCIETVVKKEISEEMCTCSKKTPETEVEEIATGISRTLLQTQQLREKLCENVTTNRKTSKNSIISSIYNPKSALDDKHSSKNIPQTQRNVKLSKTISTGGKVESKPKTIHSDNKKATVNAVSMTIQARSSKDSMKNSNSLSTNIDKSKEQKQGMNYKPKVSTGKLKSPGASSHKSNEEKTEIKKLTVKSTVKPTKRKDFLAINKLNVKTANQIGRHKDANEKVKNLTPEMISTEVKSMNINKRISTASTSELKILIEKVSLGLNATPSNVEDNCPLHNDISSQFITEQKYTNMDVIESLDRFSIPGDVIRVLKTYHTYINTELANESTNSRKRQKAVDTFLGELESMNNKSTQQHEARNTQFISVLKTSISLFSNVCQQNMNLCHFSEIKKAYVEFSSMWEKCDKKEFDITQVKDLVECKKILNSVSNRNGWMLNGIWNHSSINNFQGMSRVPCIRYLNRNQLLSYFETMQQLQETQYLKDLINIFLKDIITNVKEIFDPSNTECIQLYKMIFILFQGLNPRIPVLVKTDE